MNDERVGVVKAADEVRVEKLEGDVRKAPHDLGTACARASWLRLWASPSL